MASRDDTSGVSKESKASATLIRSGRDAL